MFPVKPVDSSFMDPINSLSIKKPYKIKGLSNPYDKDDSYFLLKYVISVLESLQNDADSEDSEALKKTLSILKINYEQATDLLAVRGQVISDLLYAMLNPFNWFNAEKIIATSTRNKVVPQMEDMQKEGGKLRHIQISGQKSFLAIFLVMECVRLRSQGYQLNKERNDLENSPLSGKSEDWTQKNVIDMNEQRRIAQELFVALRIKILQSLQGDILKAAEKDIIRKRLKEQITYSDPSGQTLEGIEEAALNVVFVSKASNEQLKNRSGEEDSVADTGTTGSITPATSTSRLSTQGEERTVDTPSVKEHEQDKEALKTLSQRLEIKRKSLGGWVGWLVNYRERSAIKSLIDNIKKGNNYYLNLNEEQRGKYKDEGGYFSSYNRFVKNCKALAASRLGETPVGQADLVVTRTTAGDVARHLSSGGGSSQHGSIVNKEDVYAKTDFLISDEKSVENNRTSNLYNVFTSKNTSVVVPADGKTNENSVSEYRCVL